MDLAYYNKTKTEEEKFHENLEMLGINVQEMNNRINYKKTEKDISRKMHINEMYNKYKFLMN